jgi:hypothetical protein
VVLCIQKCLQFGLDAALTELPRTGKPRQPPDDAIAWVLYCACQKPKELGYSHELWAYKLLTAHVRQHCAAQGHPALQKLSRSKLHKILRYGELRPHKIRLLRVGRGCTSSEWGPLRSAANFRAFLTAMRPVR